MIKETKLKSKEAILLQVHRLRKLRNQKVKRIGREHLDHHQVNLTHIKKYLRHFQGLVIQDPSHYLLLKKIQYKTISSFFTLIYESSYSSNN